MDKRILISIIFLKKDLTFDNLLQWCKAACQCFTPGYMSGRVISKGKTHKYNEKKFYSNLEAEYNSNKLSLRLTDHRNNLFVSQINDIFNTIILSAAIYEDKITVNYDKLLDQMMMEQGVVAYECSLEDDFWQNQEDLSYYQSQNHNKHEIKTKRREFGLREEIVDTEFNPGHSHMRKGIWFGSCYRMWFGKKYYQFINKEKLKEFTGCYENKEMDNDIIRITLYKNIWDYERTENRNIQWAFRDFTGMDEAAHSFESKKEDTQGASDPEVEILSGKFPNGGIRVMTYYFDEEGNPVSRSKAVKMKSYELSEKGKILFCEERDLNNAPDG